MFLVVSGSSRHGREGGTEQRCSYYGGQEAERGTKLGSWHDLPRHGSGNLLPPASRASGPQVCTNHAAGIRSPFHLRTITPCFHGANMLMGRLQTNHSTA